jgi:hypothetical protein
MKNGVNDNFFTEEEMEQLLSVFDEYSEEPKKKCECGADSVYGKDNSCHDHWCPKYKT